MRSLQNWELMLETWVPESNNAASHCRATITGASLEYPTHWAMASGLRKGTGAASCCPVLWSALILVSLGLGLRREYRGPTAGCCSSCQWGGVELHSLGSSRLVYSCGWSGAFPCHMAPALAHKTLERVRVLPVGCTFMPDCGPLTGLSLIPT